MKYFSKLKIMSGILVLSIFSCNQQEFKPKVADDSSQVTDFTVAEARDWYLAGKKNARINGEDKKPIWEDASQKQISASQSAVIVPVIMKNPLGYKINDKREGKEKKEEDNFVSADVKVDYVFIKDHATQQIKQLERRIMSDDDYYYKKKKIKIDPNDFDGHVYFFDQDEKLEYGLIYENGKIKGTLGKAPKNAKTNAQIEVCTAWYSRACYGTICGDWTYTHTTCETYYVDTATSGGSSISLIGIGGGGGGATIADILSISTWATNQWNDLTQAERNYFTLKPWLLLDALSAKARAVTITESYYCTNDDNGIANAFKHAFWSATLSMLVGPRTALEITDAHEANSFLTLPGQMDLHNNDLGIKIYKNLSVSDRNQAKIIEKVLQAIDTGQGRWLSPTGLTPTSTVRCP